jgi:protein-disulfide isomerase
MFAQEREMSSLPLLYVSFNPGHKARLAVRRGLLSCSIVSSSSPRSWRVFGNYVVLIAISSIFLSGVFSPLRSLWAQKPPSLAQPTPFRPDSKHDGSARASQEASRGAVYPWLAAVSATGAIEAPVTIVEFSDFECPFCGKVAPVIGELLKAYPNQIRLIFKHKPLPIHPHAALAHEAALAAEEQGKFWEMHDLLFANQKRLERADLLEYAKQLNLDVVVFQQALDSHRYKPVIEQNLAEARGLGVDGTPTCFVNGRKIIGARSLAAFKGLIDEALGLAKPVLNAATGPGSQKKEVSIGHAPVRGSPAAEVTIVEFADFQCPFCARALPVLQQLLAEYPDKVKWVFKGFPLDFHHDSLLAHEAALAAGAQGKFWEMHDRLFEHQGAMKRDDLLQKARDLNLDMTRFVADLDSGHYRADVEADRAEGVRLGVNGTPTFFINGEGLVGLLPVAEFRSAIEQALEFASKDGKGAIKATKTERPPSPRDVVTSSTKGPAGAPLTIVWFSDLQIPLTPKTAELVRDLISAYPEKVRIVFKNCPLQFHSEDLLAHEAALAAGAQAKFWPMHDLILANQGALTKEDLVGYAVRLGLDREKFSTALARGTYRQQINDDLAEARKLSVFGVPVFFVNGKRVDGVQPLAMLKDLIDSELRRVQVASANL